MIFSVFVSVNLSRGNVKSLFNFIRKNVKILFRSEGDESIVVEKIVVIFECEKLFLFILYVFDDKRSV